LHLVHATQVNADHTPTASCNAHLVIVLAILVIAVLQAGAQEIVLQVNIHYSHTWYAAQLQSPDGELVENGKVKATNQAKTEQGHRYTAPKPIKTLSITIQEEGKN
jgi:hypothetical protein